jgi:radical SAM superfamily enzyme YgiQ (UPF0313 family)
MKVLLANFNNHENYSGMYSLAALASYIDTIPGVQVQVIDAIRQPFYQILTTFKPDIVGLTSYTVWYGKVVAEAHKIKSILPSCKIVIGGHHITSMPESLRAPPFDYAIMGEGEEALASLCRGEQNIKGLISTNVAPENDRCTATLQLSDPVEVGSLPVVDLPRYTDISNYSRGLVGLVASRGCLYNCKYCNIRAMSKKVRLYPVERVAKEIQLYYDSLKARIMIFWDDVFGLDRDWTLALIEELRKRNLLGKIQFHIHVRANTATEERCALWKELGVVAWNMGLDFGDDAMLKATKGNDCSIEKNKESLLMAHRHGFSTGGSVIFGAPGESIDAMNKTLEFMAWYADMKDRNLIGKGSSIWFFVATALPRTEWWQIAESRGKVRWDMDCGRLSLHNWKDHFLLDDSVTEAQFSQVHEQAKRLMTRINGAWSEP